MILQSEKEISIDIICEIWKYILFIPSNPKTMLEIL